MKVRLDNRLVELGLVTTRSQAESYIKLGRVRIDGQVVKKPGYMLADSSKVIVDGEQYVSRAALKLASVAQLLELDFRDRIVLDVGSSTGGFTDFALRHGAKKVIAVDVGTNQLHPNLRQNPRVELHEQTDIRNYAKASALVADSRPDIILADVSFVSLREILPSITRLCGKDTLVVVMVKPQFEAAESSLKHKGVIKNDTMRRAILSDFEVWVKRFFVIINKADSSVAGSKGNLERFYLLTKSS